MSTRITCSWCHSLNHTHTHWCEVCGHSAWLPRCECDCVKCVGVLFAHDASRPSGDPQTPPVEPIPFPPGLPKSLSLSSPDGDDTP